MAGQSAGTEESFDSCIQETKREWERTHGRTWASRSPAEFKAEEEDRKRAEELGIHGKEAVAASEKFKMYANYTDWEDQQNECTISA